MKRTEIKRDVEKIRAWQDRSRTPLASGPGPARKTAIRKSNPKRKAAERLRAYGPADRQTWLRALPCLVCGASPCDIAHIRTDGMGRKADAALTVPLCRHDHDEQHRIGVPAFEALHGIDLTRAAAETEAAWQRHINP